MKLPPPASHYQGGETVLHLLEPAMRSARPIGLLVNLNALLVGADKFTLICDPIHQSK